MIIRRGTIDEMASFWYKFYTFEFFSDNIESGNAEFWTADDNGRLIGELYLFKRLDDADFADGKTTAYLYGFRVEEAMRGRGIGTMLMERVLERLRELGFIYAVIGVEPDKDSNIKLYNRLGFTEKIKSLRLNPCDVDENNMPTEGLEYILLRKAL
jgi:ribosomal protein S18 acetylase RimI-like enzyme